MATSPSSNSFLGSGEISNAICLDCHGPDGPIEIVKVSSHSSSVTGTGKYNFTQYCVDCHNPHFQGQLEWLSLNPGLPEQAFLITATIPLGSAFDYVDGKTTFSYENASVMNSFWANTDKWYEKTSPGRGLIMALPIGPGNTFEVTAASEIIAADPIISGQGSGLITVSGSVLSDMAGKDFGLVYGQLIKGEINSKQVVFFDKNGGFVDTTGIQPLKGVCQACHVDTSFWKSDGTGTSHYPDENCIRCHKHINGFAHAGASGSDCVSCHGHDSGYEYSPGKFSSGSGSFQSHSTHTESDTDDVKGPALSCSDCHDINNFPYFKSGIASNNDGKFSLAETDVCDNCHSSGGTYDGIDDVVIGAKSIWPTGAYTGTNSGTLLTGKDKWCAGCHDESPATVNAVAAPNVIGNDSGSYTYGTGWGFYKTGHGLDAATTYPASGGLTNGAGIGCDACHDFSMAHVDGEPRTYAVASDNYREGYRLKLSNGENPMNIPLTSDPHTAADFRLCFDCHDANTYLQDNVYPYETNFWGEDNLPSANLHLLHLTLSTWPKAFSSDWSQTPPVSFENDSFPSCITCHNVHGSTQLSMIRDGKLVNREPGLVIYYNSSAETAVYPSATTLADSDSVIVPNLGDKKLCGGCHGDGQYSRLPIPDTPQAPILAWTGEANYINDGVNPDVAVNTSSFEFRISYTDVNFEFPNPIELWIDEDDNGTYEAGEKYTMDTYNGNDGNTKDGKRYFKNMELLYAGDGILNYRFYASDGLDTAGGLPTFNKTITLSDSTSYVDNDGDGFTEIQGDCNDTDISINPSASEICEDGVDQDCNGSDILCVDYDNDGDGYTENQGDCNDTDISIYPGASEICEDGIDQDCNGSDILCVDYDNDGDGYTENQGDCNDTDISIYPGASEICEDGIDQDCNGSDLSCDYVDNDGDGFTENQGDCNDTANTIYPGAPDICADGIDQDCNTTDVSCIACDSSHLHLCTLESECTGLGGFWWSATCLGIPESETVIATGGRVWMDRNLGATQVATSLTDAAAYGDLYQWGRGADGHQLRTSDTTTTLSSTDTPGHGDFIASYPQNDWRDSLNNNPLWQGGSGTNNPCPDGFRLPTYSELGTERDSWSSLDPAGAFASPLKLVLAGYRPSSSAMLNSLGQWGIYWSSTTVNNSTDYIMTMHLEPGSAMPLGVSKAFGNSVRCIMD